jgi:hypothetical protein
MTFRIEYLQDGDVIGTEGSAGTLEAAQQAARMGLVEHRALLVRVIDVGSGAEIWSETVRAS